MKQPQKVYLTCPVCHREAIEGKGFPNHMGTHNWTRQQTDAEVLRQTGRQFISSKRREYGIAAPEAVTPPDSHPATPGKGDQYNERYETGFAKGFREGYAQGRKDAQAELNRTN